MVLPFLDVCGAVPFDPVSMAYDPAGQSVNNRVLVCCHCHVMDSLAFLDPSDEPPLHPSQEDNPVVDSLPDVVPRPSGKVPNCLTARLPSDEEEPDSPLIKDLHHQQDKSAAADWKQVGKDLRRIADQFETLRRPAGASKHRNHATSSSSASSWIQTCILHGLVAYAGWRIQRWISG